MEKNNLNHHISRQFNYEIEEVRNKLLTMGGLVEQQIEWAVTALVDGNLELAESVIHNDDKVNKLEQDIDEHCLLIIARRQPAAFDLRMIIVIIKAITDLERIGDQACRIAKMAINLDDYDNKKQNFHELEHLGDLIKLMLNGALDAFARLNVEGAVSIAAEDQKVDQEYIKIVRQLTSVMMEDPKNVMRALNVMGAIRAMERIGDHAVNICEYVVYMVKGEDVRHISPEQLAEKFKS